MKELEKTKRISIATTLFILIVIIALLVYKRPKYFYTVNPEHTLEKLVTKDYFVSLNEIDNPNYVLIDVRNQYEFQKGHLNNAINIHTPVLLITANFYFFEELKINNKIAILYGKNPTEANSLFMLLYQLGFEAKILTVENNYSQNKLITKSVNIEKEEADINSFIKESIKKAKAVKKKVVIVKPPKKIIPIKKKKKMPVEGGC
jgi:rhodanese-related sulfurtransferase